MKTAKYLLCAMPFISIIGITHAQNINQLGSINLFLYKSNLFGVDSLKTFAPFANDKLSVAENNPFVFGNTSAFQFKNDSNEVAVLTPNITTKNSSILLLDVPAPVFQYNNGKGFDVYKSPIDGMSILEPDKTFKSNMPNMKVKIISTGK